MGMRAAENSAVEHTGHVVISAVGRPPRDLVDPVWPHGPLANPLIFAVSGYDCVIHVLIASIILLTVGVRQVQIRQTLH